MNSQVIKLNQEDTPSIVLPDWPIPEGVCSCITTRLGGVSQPPFDSFNIAAHVDDEPVHVAQNRARLYQIVGGPIQWLQQVHGTDVFELGEAAHGEPVVADGVYSSITQQICAVMTADCLPLLLCHKEGRQVAALHCGWRSLMAGIIPKALNSMLDEPKDYIAYLGPAISQAHFEVGEDVLRAAQHAESQRTFCEPVINAFAEHTQGKYYADIYRIARSELNGLGLEEVYGGKECTFADEEKYYSYRRDGACGRMASLIWIAR